MTDCSEGKMWHDHGSRPPQHLSLSYLVAATEQDHKSLTERANSLPESNAIKDELDNQNENDFAICGMCSSVFTSMKECKRHIDQVRKKSRLRPIKTLMTLINL